MRQEYEISEQVSIKTLRQLTAAEGYLELGMPTNAMDQLDQIDEVGPFEPVVELLRGKSLQAQHRYSDAIEPLQRAARMIPAPHNQDAWLSLSICFREDGQQELADVTEMFANTPPVPPEWESGLRSTTATEKPCNCLQRVKRIAK